jgi:hypothetical protein
VDKLWKNYDKSFIGMDLEGYKNSEGVKTLIDVFPVKEI